MYKEKFEKINFDSKAQKRTIKYKKEQLSTNRANKIQGLLYDFGGWILNT